MSGAKGAGGKGCRCLSRPARRSGPAGVFRPALAGATSVGGHAAPSRATGIDLQMPRCGFGEAPSRSGSPHWGDRASPKRPGFSAFHPGLRCLDALPPPLRTGRRRRAASRCSRRRVPSLPGADVNGAPVLAPLPHMAGGGSGSASSIRGRPPAGIGPGRNDSRPTRSPLASRSWRPRDDERMGGRIRAGAGEGDKYEVWAAHLPAKNASTALPWRLPQRGGPSCRRHLTRALSPGLEGQDG